MMIGTSGRAALALGLAGFQDFLICLLPFVAPHRRVDLLFDRRKVERCWRLHRWILDRGLRQLGDSLLDLHEAPELARHKVIHKAAALIVERFAADRRSPLERILAAF